MNKKIYIAPLMDSEEIGHEKMICESVGVDNDAKNGIQGDAKQRSNGYTHDSLGWDF